MNRLRKNAVHCLLLIGISAGCQSELRDENPETRGALPVTLPTLTWADVFVAEGRMELETAEDDPLGEPTAVVGDSVVLAIADGFASNVKIFDWRGRLLETVGRAGDGPGELRSIGGAILLNGDSLGVVDRAHRAVSWFNVEGEFQVARPVQLATVSSAVVWNDSLLVVTGRGFVGDRAISTTGDGLHVFRRADGRLVTTLGPRPVPRSSAEASAMNYKVAVAGGRLAWGLMTDRVVVVRESPSDDESVAYEFLQVAATPWAGYPGAGLSPTERARWYRDNWTALSGLYSSSAGLLVHFESGSRREGTARHEYVWLPNWSIGEAVHISQSTAAPIVGSVGDRFLQIEPTVDGATYLTAWRPESRD